MEFFSLLLYLFTITLCTITAGKTNNISPHRANTCSRIVANRSRVVLTSARYSINGNSLPELCLRTAGPLFYIGLQITSLKSGLEIYREKSVGNRSSLSYFSLLSHGYIWTVYGILLKDLTVLLPSFSAVLVALTNIAIYQSFSKTVDIKKYFLSFFVLSLTTFAGVKRLPKVVGVLACVLTIALAGSPLAVIKTVISEKSTASLPFGVSVGSFTNSLGWFCYGWFLTKDPFVYMPQLLGLLLTGLQLALFVVYGFS